MRKPSLTSQNARHGDDFCLPINPVHPTDEPTRRIRHPTPNEGAGDIGFIAHLVHPCQKTGRFS
jgi:hypothetical protein